MIFTNNSTSYRKKNEIDKNIKFEQSSRLTLILVA